MRETPYRQVVDREAAFFYHRFSPRLRVRYGLEDLRQEGHLVLLGILRRKRSVPIPYLRRALQNRFNEILRWNMSRCRDPILESPLQKLDPARREFVRPPPSGTELRVDLRLARSKLSRDAARLADVILAVADGRISCAYKDLTLRAVSKRLRLTYREAKQATEELRRFLWTQSPMKCSVGGRPNENQTRTV